MKLAAMQPYFLTYLGYFDLIDAVDLFIIFDTPKFQKKSWMTRNRVLHPDIKKEFQYINLSTMKCRKDASCSEVIIASHNKTRFIQQNLQVYKRMRAINYNKIDCDDFMLVPEHETTFSRFIFNQLKNICEKINIVTKIVLLSETDYEHDYHLSPGLHALKICKFFGASTYINAPGGRDFFDHSIYKENSVQLSFIKPILNQYKQSKREFFVQDLSILDALMFNKWSSFKQDYINYELG